MSLLPVVGGDMEMDEVQNPLIGADACRVFVPVVVVGQMTFITALIDVSSVRPLSVRGVRGAGEGRRQQRPNGLVFWQLLLLVPRRLSVASGAVHI